MQFGWLYTLSTVDFVFDSFGSWLKVLRNTWSKKTAFCWQIVDCWVWLWIINAWTQFADKVDRRIKSCPNIQYAKLSLSPKTNLQACPSTDPARPIFWTNRHHWCHWLESAEHMDPWRHHGASSLLPALNQARLLSLCAPSVELRGPTGSPIPPAPGLPGVGQYGAQRRGCKVKTALRLPSLPLEYLNGSRHRNPVQLFLHGYCLSMDGMEVDIYEPLEILE